MGDCAVGEDVRLGLIATDPCEFLLVVTLIMFWHSLSPPAAAGCPPPLLLWRGRGLFNPSSSP